MKPLTVAIVEQVQETIRLNVNKKLERFKNQKALICVHIKKVAVTLEIHKLLSVL